jgi:hypothetical protein
MFLKLFEWDQMLFKTIKTPINIKFSQNMLKLSAILSLVCCLTIFGCMESNSNAPKKHTDSYNLNSPDATLILPASLREVSGLTFVDSTSVACIQDEKGSLFIFSITENKITKKYNFHIDGDYEGIAKAGKAIFILRSDGTLFEVSDFETDDFSLKTYLTGIPAKDNEGLCYDSTYNRLLIACKSNIGKGSENKDKRAIYGFDLATKTLTPEPVFDISLNDIKEFAANYTFNPNAKSKKKGKAKQPDIKFRTSGICIHPLTKKLYLLSASDYMLFIFNMNGNIEQIEQLDGKLFNQAEGISFLENGDMLIANEGKKRSPTLLRFNYKKH